MAKGSGVVKTIIETSYDFPPQPFWGVGPHVSTIVDFLNKKNMPSVVVTRNRFNLPRVSRAGRSTIIRSNYYDDKVLLTDKQKKTESYVDFDLLIRWNLIMEKKVSEYFTARNIEPSLIHNHTWMTWPLSLNLSKNFNIPIISSYHFLERQYKGTGSCPTSQDLKRILRIERESFGESDKLIFFSQESKRFMCSEYDYRNNRKMIVIPHGVDMKEVRRYINAPVGKADNSKIRILFVGRLVKEKGVYYLLRVAREIVRENGDIVFYFVGDSGDLDRLKENNSSKNVIFTGRLQHDNLYRLYSSADIFCLPSLTENLSLSLIEAMSFGLAVVTTSGHTVPRVVNHYKSGLLLNLHYGKRTIISIKELHRLLTKLALDSHLRISLGRGAKKTVSKKFNISYTLARLLEVYEEM